MLVRLLALLATGEAELLKRRIKAAVIAYAALALTAFLALFFVVLAAYLAAAARWGAVQAAIWFAVAFFVLTALSYLIYRIVGAVQRRAQQRKRVADTGMLAGASALAVLPSLISKKGGMAAVLMALAGIAGYAAYREFGEGKGNGRTSNTSGK